MHTAQRITIYWRRFTSGSTNRRIFGSIITVGGFGVGVKTVAFIKELIVAQAFGTSDALDAFLVAFVLPTYLLLVVASPFAGALVPSFVRVEAQAGREQAQRLLSSVVMLLLVLVGSMSLLLAVASQFILPLIGSGFSPGKLMATLGLLLVLLPAALLGGLIELAVATANTGGRFAFTSASAVVIPLATVVTVLTLREQWGAYAIVAGVVGGYLVQLSLLIWRLRQDHLSLWPRWHGWSPDLRRVLAQYWPVVLGAALHNSSMLVDQAMTTPLGSGSVAALNYGNKLVALVQGVGAMALGTAILPYFARMVAAQDWRGVSHSLMTYTKLIVLTTVPFALGVVAISYPLIALVYQRGAFTAADTLVVSRVQAMFVLQLPFFTLGILFVQITLSLGATRILLWGAIMNVALNIILNYVLRAYFDVAGIALSTTLMYAASSLYLFIMLRRKLPQIETNIDANHSAHSIAASGRR